MTALERCLDALDHIVRVTGMAHHLTKRLYWIQARSQSAIDGDEKWRDYDYPRNRNAAQENLRKHYRQAKEMLKAAKCPSEGCDGQGYTVVPDDHGEAMQEQCQWCAERKELIG